VDIRSLQAAIDPLVFPVQVEGHNEGISLVELVPTFQDGRMVGIQVRKNGALTDALPLDAVIGKEVTLHRSLVKVGFLRYRLDVIKVKTAVDFDAAHGGNIEIIYLKKGSMAGLDYKRVSVRFVRQENGEWQVINPLTGMKIEKMVVVGYRKATSGGIRDLRFEETR